MQPADVSQLPAAVFQRWCAQTPAKMALTWLDEQGKPELVWSRSDLRDRANAIAHALIHNWACSSEDRVILMYLPGLDFMAAFWGCLFCNVVAVPVYPVDLRKFAISVGRFGGIVESCQPKLVLSHTPYLNMKRVMDLKNILSAVSWPSGLEFRSTEDLTPTDLAVDVPPARPDDLAFLQYTSGSTGDPKGVMISHGNLQNNLQTQMHHIPYRENSLGCCWAPQYHDAGLIANLLLSTYCGGSILIMSPLTFIRNPPIWFQVISKNRCNLGFGPNFGYDLTLRKTTDEQLKQLDLSCVKFLANGAEPVKPSTVYGFNERFAAAGLSPTALNPCWGLAENVVYCCGRGFNDGDPGTALVWSVDPKKLESGIVAPGSREIVGCGYPGLNVDITVVDAETGVRSPVDRVGELWVSGPSVAKGYWGKAELSKATFQNVLDSDPSTTWLRTGDLGFIHQEQIFVCGRLKDMMIVRGRNIYPQDVERTLEAADPLFRRGCSAAFVVDVDGEEQLAVVAEVQKGDNETYQRLVEKACEAVSSDHQLRLHALLLLQTRTVPKTTSGKIQRRKCKAEFLIWQEGGQETITPSVSNGGGFLAMSAVLGLGMLASGEVPWFGFVAYFAVCLLLGIYLRKETAPNQASELHVVYSHSNSASASNAHLEQQQPANESLPTVPSACTQVDPNMSFQDTFRTTTEALILRKVHEVAGLAVSADASLLDSGLDSLNAADLSSELQTEFGGSITLDGALLFDYDTPATMSEFITKEVFAPRVHPSSMPASPDVAVEIGVVGMACRASGIDSVDDLWEVLLTGKVQITDAPPARWAEVLTEACAPKHAFFGAFIEDIEAVRGSHNTFPWAVNQEVDLHITNTISVASEALGAAKAAIGSVSSKELGLFTALCPADFKYDVPPYCVSHLVSSALHVEGVHANLDAACSGGYLALAAAFNELTHGKCSRVVAGGAFLMLKADATMQMASMGMLSRSGCMRPLSAKSDGMICGEACAAVVLQRNPARKSSIVTLLAAAQNQNNPRQPIGFADGGAMGLVAQAAIAQAGIQADDLSLTHLHATGNPASDGPEVDGVLRTLLPPDRQSILTILGHKANVGHSVAASGVLGIIVTALSLQKRMVPATLHLQKQLKNLRDKKQLLIPAEVVNLHTGGKVLASINGTSVSGDNVNLIVQHDADVNITLEKV